MPYKYCVESVISNLSHFLVPSSVSRILKGLDLLVRIDHQHEVAILECHVGSIEGCQKIRVKEPPGTDNALRVNVLKCKLNNI